MINNNTLRNRVVTATPPPKAGQLWRDGHPEGNQAILLVLDVDLAANRVLCKRLNTGKISKVRLEQFNRGKTGYFFAGELRQLNKDYLDYLENRDAQGKSQIARSPKATDPAPNRRHINPYGLEAYKAAQEYLAARNVKIAKDHLASKQLLAN